MRIPIRCSNDHHNTPENRAMPGWTNAPLGFIDVEVAPSEGRPDPSIGYICDGCQGAFRVRRDKEAGAGRNPNAVDPRQAKAGN